MESQGANCPLPTRRQVREQRTSRRSTSIPALSDPRIDPAAWARPSSPQVLAPYEPVAPVQPRNIPIEPPSIPLRSRVERVSPAHLTRSSVTNRAYTAGVTSPAGPPYPLPSRRSLHAPASESVSASSLPIALQDQAPETPSHGVGRASLLVALTAMTVAVPVSGFVGPDSSLALPSRTLGAATGGSSWAGGEASTEASAALTGTVSAASRTRVRTPLEASACLAADAAADGSRTVIAAKQLFWPLMPGTYSVTSGFAWRISPISGELLMHEGVDMSAPLGTPIHAVADGVVVELVSDYRSGTYLRIQHTASDGSIYYSAYAHQYMSDIIVRAGQTVTAGEQIGAVGSNGWSTGAHLHFEIRDAGGTPTDPMVWMENQGAIYIGQECG